MAKRNKWYGKKAKKIAQEAAMEALYVGAEDILTESIDETPVLSGTLRRSGTVTQVPKERAVYISYNTPYAVVQHEDLNLNHPRGGKAKYLETPFNRNKGKVQKFVGLKIKKALRDTD